MPARAELVIGSSRAEVIAGLGPPESIQLSQGGMQWTYLDLQGRTLQGAVQFAGNRVTGVADPAAVLVPGIRPDRGPYLGQSRGELTMEMGGAILDQEGDRTTLHFVPSGVKVVTFQDVVVEILK